jgi:uncharacterized protein involved in exopolysaccharide biosynthesis
VSGRPSPARPDSRLAVVGESADAASFPAESQDPQDSGLYPSIDYLGLVLARWRRLAILFVVGAAAGIALSLSARPMYKAGVTLAVAAPKIGEQEVRDERVKDFVTLLENNATAQDTIHRFKLDEAPYNLGPEEFLLRSVRAEQIGNTNLLRLTVRLPDPRLAAELANDMAGRARDLTQRLTQAETTQARASLAEQLTESRRRLEAVQGELEKVKSEGQYDLLKKDIEAQLEQRKDLREILVKIAGERAWQARGEAELARRTRIDTLTRTVIDADSTTREAARASGTGSLLGLTLKNEFVNQSYDELDALVSKSRADLAGYEKQRDELVRAAGLDTPSLGRLAKLYALETRVARLETELEIARRAYLEVSLAHEQARTQVTSRSATLQIVDPALAPRQREPRYTARNAALGAIAAVSLGLVAILLPPMITRPRRTSDA